MVQDHEKQMKDMNGNQKVRILLAQAIFGNLLIEMPYGKEYKNYQSVH